MRRLATSSFGLALRAVRKAKGVAQEEFDQVSSRTYVSALERGLKQPTLPKIDALAAVLNVHPLTLLVLSYCRSPTPATADVQRLLATVQQEVVDLARGGSD